MIEIRLLPDGLTDLPVEARDHGVLAAHLEGNGPPNTTPASRGWRSIEREIEPTGVVLRLPGTLDDYQTATLDGIEKAITGNVNGLKAHADGWTVVEP